MDRWIEHFAEPSRLILAWQAPDEVGDRQRWAVGELRRTGQGASLHYFSEDAEFPAYNRGQPFSKIKDYGYAGYPAFPPQRSDYDEEVLEAFMRRLPPRSRPDFVLYRRHLRLRDEVELSDFGLLGLSEAQLPSDGFSLVDPLDPEVEQLELVNEVAGHRYYINEVPPLRLGQEVFLAREPGNIHDPHAVQVMVDGRKIGNINRLQAPAFERWIDARRLHAVVDRFNGRPDRPRLFLFVEVAPKS